MAGSNVGWALLLVGLLLLVGYAAHVLGRRAHVPRVTLLLLVGVLAGPSGLDLLPTVLAEWFPLVTALALSIIGFILGERFFSRKRAKGRGPVVLGISIAETLCAALAVFVVLLLVGAPVVAALLLAGIAPASAPAATVDVVRESGAKGELTDTVLGVVAVDDAFGIIIFSLLLIVAQAVSDGGPSWMALLLGLWDVAGAILLGVAIGLPMAWVTGRARPGELTLLEALGFVLVTSGLASLMDVSYLLACIALGAVVARRAHHHTRPLHAIEGISQPFLVIFFLLAGFELDLGSFVAIGGIGAAYVIGRGVGLVGGGWLGARLSRATPVVRRHVGWCLLPQAGVALGLGLVAIQEVPELEAEVLSLLVGTTFLFEVIGPIATRASLRHAKETESGRMNEANPA